MEDYFTIEGKDGLPLAVQAWGNPTAPPVILSHGGGQTRHSWSSTAQRLANKGWYALTYDHRGHGDSGWSADGVYGGDLFGADQLAIAATLSQPPVLIGASLGGLSSLIVEGMMAKGTFKAIVLVDITPQMDKAGTTKIMDFMGQNVDQGFASLEEAADIIARYTGREKRINPQGLGKNLRLRDGRYYWHWDPNFLKIRGKFSGKPQRLIEATQTITCPMLLVRGHLSDVVTQEVADEFLTLVPHCRYVSVEGARHMVAGDKNDVFTTQIEGFLNDLESAATLAG